MLPSPLAHITMPTTALNVIREEHQALSAMLTSLSMLLKQARQAGVVPPFDVVRAMLLYVDEFPERLHHRKESELLFPKLRERAPELAPVLERLEREHQEGEHAIRELEHLLLAFEVMGNSRRDVFEAAAERYLRFYIAHMALEEAEVLPAARRCFSAADWAELDAAFAANRDPLTGHEPEDGYRPLFSKIVLKAPAPVGLGPAL